MNDSNLMYIAFLNYSSCFNISFQLSNLFSETFTTSNLTSNTKTILFCVTTPVKALDMLIIANVVIHRSAI